MLTITEYELSVSSNGSTWVKLLKTPPKSAPEATFSILERIDVGETCPIPSPISRKCTFSILERIDVGETTG